ncbi:MAG TPA: aromatic ring-hydroxylating dioxygenase subunit alpha [Anaerolineales bacterium]|nr:aromatic ring-hydroxylating dioxygenase subunit alpha [Anaerolineales bacterium]
MSTFMKTDEHYVPGSLTLPQKYYTSDEVFEREQQRIFRRYWWCAGHQSRIPEPGDYFLLDVFHDSLIILRDRQRQVRAFYNVCRHRGTRICEEAQGRFRGSIQCSYHAWTYGLDGKLIGAPFMKEIEDFRWEDYPLQAAPVAIWEGFIFVHLGQQPPRPFEETYAALMGRFKAWNIEGLKSYRRIAYDVRSNWKYIFQNFNECYHCPTIHPLLNKFTDYTSGTNDLMDGPFLGGYMDVLNESMTVSGRACALPLGDLGPDARRAYYYSVLPNLLLNIHPDYVMFHLVMPKSPGHSMIVSEWLFHPGAFDREDFRPQEAVQFWDETNLQDWHVCELGQLGVSSQAYAPGWYTPRESLLAAFDRHYIQMME